MVMSNPFVEKVEEKEAEKKNSGKKPLTNDVKEPIEFQKADVEVEELPKTEIEQPPQGGKQAEGGEVVVDEEEFSLDDSKNICQAMWNIPSVIFGEHLILEESQTNGFAKQFHIYCVKKGVNPFEYLFDEFGLVIAALPIVQYMRTEHTKFKEIKEKTKRDKEREGEEDEN